MNSFGNDERLLKERCNCHHLAICLSNSDELLRNYLLIGFLIKTQNSMFLDVSFLYFVIFIIVYPFNVI